MTIISEVNVTCAICSHVGEQSFITSTSTFSAPDLDLRPGRLARDNLRFEVQTCSFCRYCSTDISVVSNRDLVAPIIAGDEYQGVFAEEMEQWPAGNSFCASLIHAATDNPAAAGWASLRAARVHDDHAAGLGPYGAHGDQNATAHADTCRRRTIKLFKRAQEVRLPSGLSRGGLPHFGGSSAFVAFSATSSVRRVRPRQPSPGGLVRWPRRCSHHAARRSAIRAARRTTCRRVGRIERSLAFAAHDMTTRWCGHERRTGLTPAAPRCLCSARVHVSGSDCYSTRIVSRVAAVSDRRLFTRARRRPTSSWRRISAARASRLGPSSASKSPRD
jgi:hypothetical protein